MHKFVWKKIVTILLISILFLHSQFFLNRSEDITLYNRTNIDHNLFICRGSIKTLKIIGSIYIL